MASHNRDEDAPLLDIAEDFGQRVDLTRRIREILANYLEGTTVLKELIQNADDAGATEVCFCLDRRKHGVESLLYGELAAWQGPALLAYNNAQFSADDFDSISKLGGSKKQRDPWKTGRFGVGFNSVYHLSDLPSFVSGRHIVFFDPHCKFLPKVSAVNPGKRIDFVKSAALTHYRDQFLPYCMFGCDMETLFEGTLFRFPLRTVSQAAQSQLSRQHYSEKDVAQLFDELSEEASLCMLFLKNVEIIKFYDWHPVSENPCLSYSCSLESPTTQIQWHRQALTRLAKAWTSQIGGDSLLAKQLDFFVLRFKTEKFVATEVVELKAESFMIVQCLETSTSRIGAMSSLVAKQQGICLLPWAAVAAKISADYKQVECQSSCNGKAFCFLPLPLKTNLPIHVNGFFELSSNRRDIWYGADMEGMGKMRADWNTLLLNEVVTSAYQHLLLVAPEHHRLAYSFWPSGSYVEPWKSIVASVYKKAFDDPILHSKINGGEWISLSQAVLHDEDMPNCDKQALALIALGLPLVRLPKHLFQTMSVYCDFKMVCPNLIRQHLKNIGIHGLHIDWDSGLDLLQYCLADVVDEEASANLSGLPLVPLASGKFGVFGERKSQMSYFLCTEKQQFLMEKVKHKIVERNIPMSSLQRLWHMAEASSTNLNLLTATDFVKCLIEILPSEWKDMDVVEWIPNKENHPSEDWMVSLWEYLRESCPDLSLFDSWPLLPTNDGSLCRMQKSLGIIKGDVSLSKSLESILGKMGCQIMRSDLCVVHPSLSKFVQSPTASGILDAISCAALNTGCTYKDMLSNTSDKERIELRSFLLDARWYREKQMRDDHLHVLKSLPIFELHRVQGCKQKQFVDLLSEKRYLPPSSVDESLIGVNFLRTESQKEIEVLTRALHVQQMDRANFFRFSVVDQMKDLTSSVREQAMLTILKELPLLCLQDPTLKDTLRNLSCISTPSGELRPPKLLYDPRIEEFQVLLNDKESFPSEVFRTEEILDALQSLGLQTLVSPNTVLQSAHQIELMLQVVPDEASTRGFLLLTYLEVNAPKLFQMSIPNGINNMLSKVTDIFQSHRTDTDISKKFWNELASICWCPVLVQPPYPGLPWPSATTPLAPPKLIRLPADLWLASASMRILNGDCRSAFLSQKLGWTSHLGGNVLAAQLLELGRSHANADSQGLKQALATVIPRVYALLTEKMGTEELEIVKTVLEGSQWVWVGDRFVSVHEAVLSGPLHLAPYLWVIPADLAVFKELLMELGVRESLAIQDFTTVLSKMALLKNNTPLDSLELKTVIWILQHLADSGFSEMGETVLVPDAHGMLVPSSNLAYNDAPWLLGDSQPGGVFRDAMIGNKNLPRFVHANISNDVAERLNIKSLRRLLLAESADSLNVTLHGAAEAFGQHEALTTRLKHIVDMYADGPGILCELLQNSDDAGASEVTFLLDQSQYGTSSLLSPRMSDWQGPALYCFNNSVFTTKDLYAISRIGQDSKLEKPHAVGRFGLGFNSVYHFTDVPSFVSGNNFVIFDPHACHLPGISPSHPGLKINYVGKGIATQFPDQCRPYMLFGCDLQCSFNGTLFRFPLRTSVTASESQIKQNVYSPEMVLSLFKSFQMIASEVLLFLRNVTRVAVHVREGLDQDMHLLYCVERHGAYKNSVYKFIRSLKDQAQDSEDFYRRLQNTPKDRLPSDCQLVTIVTHGDERHSTQVWMVSDCLGGQQAVEMATSMDNQVHGFVPWAGVAAKVGVEAGSSEGILIEDPPELSDFKYAPLEGRAFCFLPLPVKTGLPVHVNAYFELSSNRRDIWYGDDMAGGGKLRSEWNCCLLKEVSCIAYVRLLANAACQLGLSEDYFSLWPTGSLSEPWASLLRGVYLSAAELDMPVLFTKAKGGQWISPKKAVFPDCSYSQAVELGNALADAGLSLVSAPQSVVNQFQEHCPSLRFLTPQLLRSSLIRRQRALNSRAAMLLALRYCLSDIRISESVNKLEGLPLVPLATGMFGIFTCSNTVESIIVADEIEFNLLKNSNSKRLVDRSIDSELFKELYAIAQSQTTNLVLLSPILLKDLIPSILPSDWYDKRLVLWTPGEAGHPREEWMELLWRFLSQQNADLSLFMKWPLLPTSDEHHLLPLTKGSCILMGEKWSENMVSVLHKANCFLLSSSFTIHHPQLVDYVHDVSASGLLGALLAAAGGFKGLPEALKEISELEMQELRGFLLQRKWFIDNNMGAVQIEVLKHLPIFKSYRNSTFVNLLHSTRFLPPNEVDVQLLGDDFIHAESDKEESILAGYLGIKKLGKQDFYENYAFKNFTSIPLSVQEKVILSLLKDFPFLKEEVPCIQSVLSQVPVIPTMHGKLKSPRELYDPRIQELHSLIDESFFPATDFAEAGVLDVLVELGLKNSLGMEDLLDSATCVASASLTDEMGAFKMAQCLLAHIDSLGLNLENKSADNLVNSDPAYHSVTGFDLEQSTSFDKQKPGFEGYAKASEPFHDVTEQKDKEFWLKLSGISWCPALVEAPVLDLPWPKGLKNMVVPPKIIRPKSQMWHVSATMRILDGEFHSKFMMSRFGWLEKPNLSILVMQLIELSEQHAQAQQECLSKVETAGGDTQADTGLSRFNKVLDEVIPTIYNLMEESLNSENISSLKSMLEGIHCVWVGDGFVLPKEAAFVSPSHFQPYLHIIPATLLSYRTLLLALGVRETFGVSHFANVLHRVATDTNGDALNKELLDFVVRVLEAINELLVDDAIPNQRFLSAILVPDSNGILTPAKDLIYNDAPWLAKTVPGLTEIKRFVHPNVQNDLADRLGAKSLRYLSFVDKEMTKDLPCLSSDEILKILASYGEGQSVLFDLLEIADKCKAHKVHVLHDKRVHAQTSILQPNLGQFQGAALTVVFEGTELSTEEVCNLQLSPSWCRREQNSNYGAGLLSCYNITDLLLLVSKGCLYLFDPSGSILSPSITTGKVSATNSPQGKAYTLQGTDIPHRFADQFLPFAITQDIFWGKPNITMLRMPLYKDLVPTEDSTFTEHKGGFRTQSSEIAVDCILKNFVSHASTALLFLNSVESVHMSMWEADDSVPKEFFSVKVDPACSSLRNPFIGKNTKKFQLSTIFSNSNNATKMNTIDVFINQNGNCIMDKWLVALTFGSSVTKALALDRRFLSYNLSPVAGVAAHVSRNGSLPSISVKSTVLCPLPLAVNCRLPVVILGCFIVSHEGFRHLFQSSSVSEVSASVPSISQQAKLPVNLMWNQELMACVREAYVQLLSECMYSKQQRSAKNIHHVNTQIPKGTWKMLSEQSYVLWPLSQKLKPTATEPTQESNFDEAERDWLAELLIKPMFVQLADLPVWKLHGGFLARATEGMFLSNPSIDEDLLPPGAVCEFLKEHYKVFAVPCELTRELQGARVNIKVITPKMVRYLLCALPSVPKFSSIDRYIELLEYSCADFSSFSEEEQARSGSSSTLLANLEDNRGSNFGLQLSPGEELTLLRNRSIEESLDTGVDSVDIMANIRRALSQFGKAVEDFSTEAGQKITMQNHTSESPQGLLVVSGFEKWIGELKGLPCPTATSDIFRLGRTEAWVGNIEQQKLLTPLATRFIHRSCLDRPLLSKIFDNHSIQQALQIKPFTAKLLSDSMAFVLPKQWSRRITTIPWVEWISQTDVKLHSPNAEWLHLFWKNVGVAAEELSLFEQWPLVPAVIGSTVLVKVQYLHLVFMPPRPDSLLEITLDTQVSSEDSQRVESVTEDFQTSAFHRTFTEVQQSFPWLFPFLQQCQVPIFDQNFLDCKIAEACKPQEGQSLGQAIRSKLLAAQQCGHLVFSETQMSPSDCDALFSLFANEFCSVPSVTTTCTPAEIALLRSLPIHKTTVGTYTSIDVSGHCTVTPTAFFQPQSDLCLQYFAADMGGAYYRALGIQELSDSEILLKFCLPFFGVLDADDQECTLSHVYSHWETLQNNDGVVAALRNTKFVSNGDSSSNLLFQPRELLDPTTSLFKEVYREKASKFPARRFTTDKWLDILRKSGLHSTLDAEALLDCAKEVAELGKQSMDVAHKSQSSNEISEEVFLIAGKVVEAILANLASVYGSSFFQSLNEIAFVPAEMGIPVRNGNGGKRVLASYKELLLVKDWPLAWTCAPILIKEGFMPPEFSWHSLHLKSPPHFQTVLKHLQIVGERDGEDILARWPSVDGMMRVEDAFLEILKYLDKSWESLSSHDKILLQKIPFIPVSNGTRLSLASRIFVRLELNLAPFLFQLPSSYLPFVRLLTDLGMQESPTFLRMQSLLLQMQNASGYQRLNPNELSAVLRILDFMCELSAHDKQPDILPSGTIVPDEAGRLVHAQACVYIDAHGSAMVSKIDTSRLRFVHPDVQENLCIWLGVRKLSDIVAEVLDDSVPLEFTDYFGNISKEDIVQRLKSESFQQALWTLIEDLSHEIPNLKPLAKCEIERQLLWLAENLKCVKHLNTRFVIVNGKVDITKSSSRSREAEPVTYLGHPVHEYIDKKNGKILLAQPPDLVLIPEILSVTISKVLDSPTCLPLAGLFNVAVGSECIYVEIIRFRPFQHVNSKHRLKNNRGVVLGEELSTSDAAQVQVHPLRPYYAGEIVAWCPDFAPDTKLRYGMVVEDVRATSGQAVYYLQVETGSGQTLSLLSSNVFSFKSVSIGNEIHTSANQVSSSTSQAEPSVHGARSMLHQHPNLPTKDSEKNVKSFPKTVQAAAVVHAVNDMMAAVGLPLGIDQQTLLSQTLTLQEHLTAAQVALSSEHERADMAVKEAEAARASWLCRICLSSEVNSVLVPCGHVLCRNCCSAVTRCPFCRQPVSKPVNLYRP